MSYKLHYNTVQYIEVQYKNSFFWPRYSTVQIQVSYSTGLDNVEYRYTQVRVQVKYSTVQIQHRTVYSS